jgi:presenilin-like A22 family membrane protease
MKIQPSLFFKEALLFTGTLSLGIFVAYRYIFSLPGAEIIQTPSISLEDIGMLVAAIGIIWFASRVPRLGRWVFWIFLSLIVLSGSQAVIASFASYPHDVIGSFAVLVVFLLARFVLIHDLSIMIAIAGIGGVIGSMITPTIGILAFAVLSFYDIIAVYKTRHMVHMAEGMIRSGAIFGFIIPSRFKQFFAPRREAQARIGNDFMVLGSGDIGLPVIFVSSLVRQSLPQAIVVAGFVLVGLLVTHVLFVNQRQRRPMAALPPIATMTMVGYVIALLLII